MPRYQKIILGLTVIGLGLSLGYCATSGPPEPDLHASHPAHPAPDGLASPAEPPTAAEAQAPAEAPAPRWPLDELVQPFHEPRFPTLPGDEPGASVSIGTVTNGWLANAAILPLPALTYDILPRQLKRGLAFGTTELIGALMHAADAVYKQHRRRLWLGNIGRRGGGDIPWSVSHNTGRDADIAFCYTDAEGKPADPPDLVELDGDGRSVRFDGAWRFDAACTWTIVKALLNHTGVQVQYLFISGPLKKKLIAHARRKGEPKALIDRADAILGQPGMSSPHNDHLHLRIYCGKRDMEGGCVNGGQTHVGVDLFEEARTTRIQQIARLLRDPDPGIRGAAIERLVLLDAQARVDAIAERLDDEDAAVRRTAARALGGLQARAQLRRVTERFAREDDPAVQVALLDAATDLGGGLAGELLRAVIADPAFDQRLAGDLPAPVRLTFSPPAPDDPRVAEADPADEAAKTDPDGHHGERLGAADAPRFCGQVLDLSDRRLSVRLAAIEGAARSERPEPVPALIEALSADDPILRARAARALHRLTNHSVPTPWEDPNLTGDAQQQGIEAWRRWYAANAKADRKAWLAKGFQARGYDVQRLDKKSVWEIVRAIPDDDHLSYNAQRALMEIANYHPLSLSWDKHDATWHWTRWFERRRRQFGLKPCPPTLATFNR